MIMVSQIRTSNWSSLKRKCYQSGIASAMPELNNNWKEPRYTVCLSDRYTIKMYKTNFKIFKECKTGTIWINTVNQKIAFAIHRLRKKQPKALCMFAHKR